MKNTDSLTISITGSNGFLGRHTVQATIRRGWMVNAIVRRLPAAQLVASLGATPHILSPITSDGLSPIIQDSDAILHFIGITGGDPSDFDRINVGSAKIVLETAIHVGVGRVITLSGLGVDQYGNKPWATNAYFASKLKIEQHFQAHKHPWIIFRPSYILGPGDELLPYLVEELLAGTVYVAGDGNKPMQPIFVDDATEIFLKAAEGKGQTNQIYELVGPEIITMNELIDRVVVTMHQCGLVIPKYTVKHIPLDQAAAILELSQEDVDVTQSDILGDNTLIQSDFGIELSSLDTAIEAVVRTVKESRLLQNHD